MNETNTTGYDLSFDEQENLAIAETNVGTRLFIQKGGNIGIGTLTPQALFDVNGNARILGSLEMGRPIGEILHFGSQVLDIKSESSSQGVRISGQGGTVHASLRMSDNSRSTLTVGHPAPQVVAIGGNTDHTLQLGGFENDLSSFTPKMTFGTNGNVGIGTTAPGSKLEIQNVNNTTDNNYLLALHNQSNTEGSSALISFSGSAAELGVGGFNPAVFGYVRGGGFVWKETSGSGDPPTTMSLRNGNLDVTGSATVVANANSARAINATNDNTAGPEQIAVRATANGSGDGTRIGTYGRVLGDGGTGQHYGLYGYVGSTNATNITVGVLASTGATGTGTPYAGYFAGDVTVTGTFNNPSDEKLKTEVRNLGSAMDRIMALNPVRYRYRNQEFPQMRLAAGEQMGFIAQDVEAIFPELVKNNRHPETVKSTDETGNTSEWYPGLDYKGVNYLGLIPVLTRATQEQQEKILDLETTVTSKDRRIAELEDRLARLERVVEQLAANGSSAQTVLITDAGLLQNQPNPFTRETLINYAIPNTVNQAELRITDVNGRLLKTIIIDQRGEGQTRLQAQSLSAGTYFYSLVLDGAVLETRKMVLTR